MTSNEIKSVLYDDLYFPRELVGMITQYVEHKIDGNCIATIKGTSCALSDGRVLFSNTSSHVKIYNPKNDKILTLRKSIPFAGGVGIVLKKTFPGNIIVGYSSVGNIGMWTPEGEVCKLPFVIQYNTLPITFLYEMNDGIIVSVSDDSLITWDIVTGKTHRSFVHVNYQKFFAEINGKIYFTRFDDSIAELTPYKEYKTIYTRIMSACIVQSKYIAVYTHACACSSCPYMYLIVFDPAKKHYTNKLNRCGRVVCEISNGRVVTIHTVSNKCVIGVWDPLSKRLLSSTKSNTMLLMSLKCLTKQ